MDSKLSHWCEGLIEAGWLTAVVVTPLFFNIHSSRVFEPDKLTLLRSIAVMMAAAWLIRFIDGQGWRSLAWLRWRSDNSIWRMPLVLPIFLLAVAYLLSTIFSITLNVSWAGSYQRLQGTYSTLSYLVIFALMAATIRRREQVSRIVTTIIVTSIPVALYGMLQHFGLDPLPWGGDVQQRVAGHMGNSIFIAAYLILVVPLTLARIIDAFTNILQDDEIETADVIRSSIYIFALAIQIITIYWSRSRGPFLGLAVSMYAFILILLVTLRNLQTSDRRMSAADVGRALLLVGLGIILPLLLAVLVPEEQASPTISLAFFAGMVALLVIFILVMALARRGWRWLWLSWIFLAVSLAGVLGLFNIGSETAENYASTPIVGHTLQTMSSWRELPEIGRFGRLLESEGGSGRVRVLIWDGVLELIAPHDPLELPDGRADPFNVIRPIIGYGPESMYVVYNRFYQPELATIEARNASPDRSHNETFDALVITGGVGFLIWQFLYLSVFYYGFRWLGVVKSSRDRNWLILLWIGGAIVGGIALTVLLGMSFLGIAIPFGTIAGLVVYLIYYALTSRPDDTDKEINPFGIDRLLMIGLIAAVIAHYVEIHFGIAIAATRTYFFVYAALMFLIGYFIPRYKEQIAARQTDLPLKRSKRRRTRGSSNRSPGWGSSALSYGLVLALIIGILAFNFLTFTLPPGEVIESAEQVPGPGQIVYQSLFINAGLGFIESPFLFILVVMTWILGGLVMVSELAKLGQIGLTGFVSKLLPERQRFALVLIIVLALASIVAAVLPRLTNGVQTPSLVTTMGFWLALIWASVCLWAAIRLFQHPPAGRLYAGIIGLTSIVLSLPVLIAGGTIFAVLLAAIGAGIVYFLWDKDWQNLLTPAGVVFLVSITVGLLYAYVHAWQLRSGILPPPGVTEATAATVRRVLETDQAASLLTTFYVFVFMILAIMAISLAWSKFSSGDSWASLPGTVGFIILIPLALYFIGTSNLRVIQADIVYKRADPWDKQAAQTGDPSMWDNAIAIYEHAIELAPLEDFYYLWLGRAYLERSGATLDPAEQESLLRIAEDRLKQAQEINPLNTDHTANLARLNTRWAEIAEGTQRAERAQIATDYYESALSLSPNNSVIRNEYARLAFILEQDCDRAMALYDESIARDPYYTASYFDRAEVDKACADVQAPDVQDDYYLRAAESMVEALDRNPGSPRHWLQLAEIYIRLGRTDEAIVAYEETLKRAGDDMPPWQIDYTMAQWYFEEDDLVSAKVFGEKALETAPPDAVPIIEQFLSLMGSGNTETEG